MMLINIFTGALPLSLTTLIYASVANGFPSVSVPATCTNGFTAGSDTVLLTVPYPPAQVLAIIDDFKNLTWSGNPPDTVTLNGTDNTPGTAREYTLSGLNVVETLFTYYRPNLNCAGFAIQPQWPFTPDFAYVEAHNTAQVNFNGNNAYIPYDGINVKTTCGGTASILNYTSHFCANDADSAASELHAIHTQDLAMVQSMLGNDSFTSCAGLSTNSCN